jgi:hypothetical protein
VDGRTILTSYFHLTFPIHCFQDDVDGDHDLWGNNGLGTTGTILSSCVHRKLSGNKHPKV